jgi:hypothetical protein
MFEPERPLKLRALSLFHVPLPLVLLWMVAAYGYDAAVGLPGAVLLAMIVLPWSRLVSDPVKNINWTYGFAGRRAGWPGWLYVAVLFSSSWCSCSCPPTGFCAASSDRVPISIKKGAHAPANLPSRARWRASRDADAAGRQRSG